MEETSVSAITGQSILATIGERLPAMVIPGGKSFLFPFPYPFPISLSPSSLLLPPFSFLISHFIVFPICHFSFVISPFSFPLSHFPFLISPFSFLISHLSFLISPFSRFSHFVAQISANVNIYRIDSSFLHIICAFLA